MKTEMTYLRVIIIVFILFSCGGGNINQPVIQESAQEFVRLGWKAYEAGDYDTALSKFGSARKLDPNFGEAYSGLGWTNFGIQELTSASQSFVQANLLDSLSIDPIIGNIFVEFERNNYQNAITWAKRAIVRDSVKFGGKATQRYVFKHNTRANATQVHKIVALSYYYMGEFEKSYNHLKQFLNPALQLDPTSLIFPRQLLEELYKI
jgi:tetratricopeptide (TPR) repeat protein